MSDNKFISAIPLPVNQDFHALRDKGLAFIQEHIGPEWSHLNPTDPGVTILQQVCYALTELGYCNDFSIADILTDAGGEIKADDQFYFPKKILTTSPVTTADYRRYLTDGIKKIKNAVILPSAFNGLNIYQVYLYIDEQAETKDDITDDKTDDITGICSAAYNLLNKCRNLGELFLMPVMLEPVYWLICGSIELDEIKDRAKIMKLVQERIRAYIFPEFETLTNDQMVADGILANDIFNGPVLKNGYTPGTIPGEKKDHLNVMELVSIISSISGVREVSIDGFCSAPGSVPQAQALVYAHQVLAFDILASLQGKMLNLSSGGVNISADYNLNTLPGDGTDSKKVIPSSNNTGFTASGDSLLSIPGTSYRDINTYFSIQNTFPEIYAVGADAVESNASAYQVARSRQLKGYLTLFDQVIANQFSQLANTASILSFKNKFYASPSAAQSFYAVKNVFEREHMNYPVPYESFSPTYFCQPLYNVPDIKPLLKNNDSFNFGTSLQTDKELEEQSWIAYKEDPYNAYIRGLQEIMEDENTSLTRRNNILNHLLARHGESPVMIDAFINGSVYSGDNLKDKVIFKSLYLQNLGLLSYNRMKGFNFTAAQKINAHITQNEKAGILEFQNQFDKDFIFNSALVDQVEKLSDKEFSNYAGIELKLSLLFGLRFQYGQFLKQFDDNTPYPEIAEQAFWLILKRQGFIFIETGLLHYCRQASFLNGTIIYSDEINSRPVNGFELIFPSFIPYLNTDAFKKRIDLFLKNIAPVSLRYKCHFVSSVVLKQIIPAFEKWHNCLCNEYRNQLPSTALKTTADKLAVMLKEITYLK